MSSTHDTSPVRRPGLLLRFAEGLDSLLSNFVGSAQIGPYVAPDPAQRRIDIDCPSCGQPISRHATDRTAAIGRLYCPAA
jgi:hypothetical protein